MVVSVVLAYLIGSIPFALLLARRSGTDLRRIGSGNLGAANVLRASGVRLGVAVALLDVGKGAASVIVAQRFGGDGAAAAALAGFAAVIGHIYPVWLRFRGGKGVATACGVFSVLSPAAIPPVIGLFIVTVWVTRYVSLGSVAAAMALPPVVYTLRSPAPAFAAACAVASIILFRHRTNLARVRTGTERRIGARA